MIVVSRSTSCSPSPAVTRHTDVHDQPHDEGGSWLVWKMKSREGASNTSLIAGGQSAILVQSYNEKCDILTSLEYSLGRIVSGSSAAFFFSFLDGSFAGLTGGGGVSSSISSISSFE